MRSRARRRCALAWTLCFGVLGAGCRPANRPPGDDDAASRDDGGVGASTDAKVSDGCGSANGLTFATAPSANLCAAGNASAVTCAGATCSWSCADANSGSSSNCTASLSATCSGAAPATVTLKLPTGAAGNWFDPATHNGDLLNLPHPSGTACASCHAACGAGAPNTIIGYDHANPSFVCNYCHDPGTRVVKLGVSTGSMANYRSSSDGQVCTCCHQSSNNAAHGLPPAPAVPVIPPTLCAGTSAWGLLLPTWDGTRQVYSGGQFFNGM
jgi:hypothetical protein